MKSNMIEGHCGDPRVYFGLVWVLGLLSFDHIDFWIFENKSKTSRTHLDSLKTIFENQMSNLFRFFKTIFLFEPPIFRTHFDKKIEIVKLI